jgi:hypothetical protein
MAAASYSKSQLVEIIRTAFARRVEAFLRSWPGSSTGGKTADDILAEGLMLDEVFTALREAGHDAITAKDILRQALMPAGPFVAIPKLGGNFHIRMHESGGVEIITDDGIMSGGNVVLQLRPAPVKRP